MINLLSAIVDTITKLVTLVISTISSFLNLIVNIPTYANFLTSSVNFLPDLIIPFALATISIYIVLFIIGR